MSNLPNHKPTNALNIAFKLLTAKFTRRQFILAAALTVASNVLTESVLGAPPTASEAKVPGWVVEQSSSLIKQAKLYGTANGFRNDSVDAGYSLVAVAPLWKFYIFNDSSKLYFPFSTAPGKVTAAGRTSLLRATLMKNTA